MSIELSNPPGIPAPEFYRQMAVATGSRTVYLAGQVARTADGEPVGAGDLAAQVEQAYLCHLPGGTGRTRRNSRRACRRT